MASKVYKSSTHVLILITLPVRLLQQRAGKTSQTSQRIIMRKIGFALALIVFTIFIQVRPRICNHLNYLLVYQNKPPIFNLQILIYFLTKLAFRFDLLKTDFCLKINRIFFSMHKPRFSTTSII